MSKVNFFTEVFSLLENKESIDLKIQRTDDELTVLLVPKIKGKTATITISGSPEDLNDGFMDQLSIPVEKIKGLVSNAAEVKIEDAEEEEEEEEDKKEKPEGKKLVIKKAAAKKVTTKKVEGVKEFKHEEEANDIENKSTEEIEAEIQKQREEEEAAQKAAEEKAAKEAEEKSKSEEAAKLKEEFTLAIKQGDEAFEARKYEDAETYYKSACALIPDHKVAQEKFEKASKWVKQLIAAGIIVREEVGHGA